MFHILKDYLSHDKLPTIQLRVARFLKAREWVNGVQNVIIIFGTPNVTLNGMPNGKLNGTLKKHG